MRARLGAHRQHSPNTFVMAATVANYRQFEYKNGRTVIINYLLMKETL
jgi:hypothetical protein